MFTYVITLIKKVMPFAKKISLKEVIEVTKETQKTITENGKKLTTDETVVCTTTFKKSPKWQKCFPFTFFYGNGKLQPIYFFVTLFSSLASWMLWVKIHAASVAVRAGTYNSDMLSSADFGVVLGFVSSLILLYNTNKKSNISEHKDSSGE